MDIFVEVARLYKRRKGNTQKSKRNDIRNFTIETNLKQVDWIDWNMD